MMHNGANCDDFDSILEKIDTLERKIEDFEDDNMIAERIMIDSQADIDRRKDDLSAMENILTRIENNDVRGILEEDEDRIKKASFTKVGLDDDLTLPDYSVCILSGIIAATVDILLVKVPKDHMFNKQYYEGSPITGFLRDVGVNSDGELNPFLKKMEKFAKVPYDKSTNLRDYGPRVEGMYPKNHRLFSLGHDPIFGPVFGIIDMLNSTMTSIDADGRFMIQSRPDVVDNMLLTPLLWISHIVSDVCTSAGLPAPGWVFTQFLQFGKLGDNNHNIAEITKYMYERGYDFRHFMTMGTSVMVNELIIRGYHYLSEFQQEREMLSAPYQLEYEIEIRRKKSSHKLNRMLLIGNSLATGGNVLKIALNQGNPMTFNYAQWIRLSRNVVQIIEDTTDTRSTEKVVRNRERINEGLKELL